MTGAPADLRRALGDPSAVPTTLSARFLILFVLIIASTASIYGYLGLRFARGDARAAGCLDGSALDQLTRIDPAGIPGLTGTTIPVVACIAPHMDVIIWADLAGVLLVAGTAFAAYGVAGPWRLRFPNGFLRTVARRSRPGRLVPLERYDPEAAAEVDLVIARYLLAYPPVVLVNPVARASHVFGSARRPLVCLAGGLVRERRRDPRRFRAIVLHELAHLRNRDTRPTLLAATAWWSFLVLAVVPYLALLVHDMISSGLRGPFSAHEDLHTTLAITTMVTLVVLTGFTVLRDRELSADSTAGRYDTDDVFAGYLGRRGLDRPSRRPALLRSHPSLPERRRAAADPWATPPLSFAQLIGAGIGLSVLSQDVGTMAWQALLAAGFDPIPSPRTTLVLITVIALAGIGPIGALTWLIEATTWRSRLRALVTPTRPPVLAMAFGLGIGMILGEPGAVSSANASHWGVFDGVGDGSAATAFVSALAIVAIIAALSRWSWDNSGAWLPVIRGSLRRVSRWSVVIGTAAVLPWYATWWAMHDAPLIGRAYLWTPGFAEALTFRFLPLPGVEWLQITYIPLEMLGWAPGVVLLTALPVLVTTVGLLRRRVPGTPRWLTAGNPGVAFRPFDDRPPLRRALLIGAAGCALVLIAGTVLAWAGHATFTGFDVEGEDRSSLLRYLTSAAGVLTVLVASAAATIATLSHPSRSVTYGLIAALIVACFGGIITPALVYLARCGGAACPGSGFRVLFGLSTTAQPVKSIVVASIVAGIAAALPRRPGPAIERLDPGRPATILIGAGAALTGALLAAAAWINLTG